jgi:pimeloyl-ACP methyl ester carboxylesterase
LAYVRAELEDRDLHLPIGLFGISRGAGAAIITAAHHHSARLVRAILSDSAFSTDTTLEWLMKKWVHIFAKVRFVYENHRPAFWHFLRWLILLFAGMRFHCKFPSVRKSLKRLRKTPVLFIHGQKDSYIRPEQAQILFDSARSPRELWMVPRAKHNQSVVAEPDEYARRTVAFFETYLTSIPGPSHVESETKAPAVISLDRTLGRQQRPAPVPTVREKTSALSSYSK